MKTWRLRPSRRAIAVSLGAIAIAAGASVATFGLPQIVTCDGRWMTSLQVALHRGLEWELVWEMEKTQSLTLSEICTMPQDMLEKAAFMAENGDPDFAKAEEDTAVDAEPKPADHPGDWAAQRKLQLRDENGRIPFDGVVRAAEHVQEMQAASQALSGVQQISRTSWRSLGPGNIGGRIRSILIHPTLPDTMYIGSVSGGIWKTTNGGASWAVLSNFLANMAVSTMVMDRTNTNIIYAGTGEGFFNNDSIQGAGIFKTTNAGVTWTQLASTNNLNFQFVNRLAISPSNQIILAATNIGVFRSINGGTTWALVLNRRILDVDIHPTNSTLAVAGGEFGDVSYSINGGATWVDATGVPGGAGRVEIAYAPNNGNIVYASIDQANGQIWRSVNGGHSFARVNTGTNYLGAQGWYDNALWVDPVNANRLIVGGIDLWRSINGGTTLTKISQWFSAPDLSAMPTTTSSSAARATTAPPTRPPISATTAASIEPMPLRSRRRTAGKS